VLFCLKYAIASGSVPVPVVEPSTCNNEAGLLVPIPTLPSTIALPLMSNATVESVPVEGLNVSFVEDTFGSYPPDVASAHVIYFVALVVLSSA